MCEADFEDSSCFERFRLQLRHFAPSYTYLETDPNGSMRKITNDRWHLLIIEELVDVVTGCCVLGPTLYLFRQLDRHVAIRKRYIRIRSIFNSRLQQKRTFAFAK